ncbi:universal stress protein [Comamonas fluminis]|uniref:universal stress protein n=1 Tax=Comamonas fluminis TaxID=2796366 RepID=UPI001C48B390|nr:universal stress protein [Comamonas fluminis]
MFKHILIPTDGSQLSEAALRAGIQLAKEQGAQVTALFVMPDFRALIYGSRAMIAYDASEFEKSAQAEADTVLQFAQELAKIEGVSLNGVRSTSTSISETIIKQAQDSHCDLICMASHGRKGLSGILLGSETQKVLTHSSIPVLVHRLAASA